MLKSQDLPCRIRETALQNCPPSGRDRAAAAGAARLDPAAVRDQRARLAVFRALRAAGPPVVRLLAADFKSLSFAKLLKINHQQQSMVVARRAAAFGRP
jgi:hypothetical protein